MSLKDAELISKFMEQKSVNLSPLNTRLIKHSETEYEILVASSTKELETDIPYTYEGLKIKVSYGDFSPFLAELVLSLSRCVEYVENDH